MIMSEQSIVIILDQFSKLTKAIIDASSIIYTSKAGFLNLLGKTIQLYTIPEVFAETFQDHENIQLIQNQTHSHQTDDKLLEVAIDLNLPVISEDKKILKRLDKKEMPYFNSLMMLNFLFYKNKITETEFLQNKEKLKTIGRYSHAVWNVGDSFFNFLIRSQ